MRSKEAHRKRHVAIRSGIYVSAIVAIWVVSERIASNILIIRFLEFLGIDTEFMQAALGAGVIIFICAVAVFWVNTLLKEYNAELLGESFLTETGIFNLLRSYPIESKIRTTGEFSFVELVDAIQATDRYKAGSLYTLSSRVLPRKLTKYFPHRWRYRSIRPIYDDPILLDQIATYIIEKLLVRETIHLSNPGGITLTYRVNDAARDQLFPDAK